MSILQAWATVWGIPDAAIEDLRLHLTGALSTSDQSGQSEAQISSQVRLNAGRQGIVLFRNNVGAGKLENGNFVRWGLCNDSTALNKKVKSSDLIGIRPLKITPDLVGHTVGVFIAREIKASDWKYRGTERERAQLHFIQMVQSLGGDARFTASPEGDL